MICWFEKAWPDYLYWQSADKQIVKRINRLIEHIQRDGNVGIGKPESLRHQLQGYCSHRINDEHRLVYKVVGTDGLDEIRIVACRYHYEK